MKQKDNLRKLRNMGSLGQLAIAVFALILGVALVIQPYNTFQSMRVIGLIALGGFILFKLFSYFFSDFEDRDSHFALIFAAIAIGIVIIRNPYAVFYSLTLFISVLFLYQAGKFIELALDQRSLSNKYWWVSLILAAAVLAMGIWIIFNPITPEYLNQENEIRILAIFLIILAIVNVVALILNYLGKSKTEVPQQANSNSNIYG